LQATNIRCINKALGASKGEIVVPELDLDQEVMMTTTTTTTMMMMMLITMMTSTMLATLTAMPASMTPPLLQGNHGSTSLDADNINGEQVDVTTVDSLNLQKYEPRPCPRCHHRRSVT
jgi:hypothetical protein